MSLPGAILAIVGIPAAAAAVYLLALAGAATLRPRGPGDGSFEPFLAVIVPAHNR